MLAEAFQDHVAFTPGQGHQPQRNAVTVGNVIRRLGLFNRAVQSGGKAFGLGSHDVLGQIMFAGGFGHLFAHILQRDGDHLTGKRPVNRGKPIQPEIRDHPTQRRALHQQREQRKAGGQNANMALYVFGHAEVLRHRQRQRQGHRPTQAPPQDRHPVGPIHPRREAKCGQKRQDHIKHEKPRRCRRNHHNGDQEQIVKPKILQKARHQKCGQKKDQCPGPMRQHIPQLSQVGPVGGRHPPRPQIV